jgi:hypothetical protein
VKIQRARENDLRSGAPSIPQINKESYARTRNNRKSTEGQGGGESSFDASGRIRARRDASHSRRKTWRAFNEAGDCDWIIQSTPGRSKTVAAATGHRAS